MTDERDKPRRARTHAGDDDRALIGRSRRTPPHGIPVEVDPEVTPPPRLPPPPDRDSVTDRIERLELVAERLASGLEAVWPARHDGEAFARYEHGQQAQATRIDKLIDGIAATHATVDSFLMPAVKDMQGHLSVIASEWPRMRAAVEDIGPRLDKVELRFDGLSDKVDALGDQFHGVSATAAQLERRVESVERDLASHRAQDVARRVDALEKINNDAAITQRANRWWLAKIIGGVGSVIGVVVVVAKYVIDYFRH